MASQSVVIEKRALRKSVAHILKYQKHDCIGALIGQRLPGGKINVTDAVPLFHDRVMTSAVESAFELIECVALKGDEVVLGVYDAPLRYKQEDAAPLTPLAVTMAE